MGMWCRSNKSYLKLRESGFLLLPHPKTLSAYKNNVEQKPGMYPEIMEKMKKTADSRAVPTVGRRGGLFIDEMSISASISYFTGSIRKYIYRVYKIKPNTPS